METHAIPQLNAALGGRYAIEGQLGRGGMATVYLARDLRHDRPVAIKVLDPELGAVLGAERFLSEIRVTAHLQHPNLLPLFDSGETDGAAGRLLFYVMPYVEGESLRTRLEREKQLPVDEAVRITAAIAGALDYAHRHGVIHRDLKPENILLHDGQPVVADFGIALAVSNAGGQRITQTGLSLGTPQYMSPEQATGDRQLDNRTDIYSLGAVAYEMLTGEPPHTGSTAQAIIARVLTDKPRPVRSTRDSVPPPVAAAVERALAKIPADRFASALEFAEAMTGARPVVLPEGIATPASIEPRAPARTSGWGERSVRAVPWIVAVFATAVAAYVLSATREPAAQRNAGVVRVTIPLGDSTPLSTLRGGRHIALAPDGSRFAYTTDGSAGRVLAVRALDDLVPKPLPGTENAVNPTFSPDGRSIAFQRGDSILAVPVAGGPLTHVADLPKAAFVTGMSWDDHGDILFAAGVAPLEGTLWRVPAAGGVPTPVARGNRSRGQMGLGWPEVLPGSRAALVTIFGGQSVLGGVRLGVVDLDGGRVTELGIAGMGSHYLPPGYIVYTLPDRSLMTSRFDARRLRVLGSSVQLGQDVRVTPGGAADVAVSATGAMIALSGTEKRRVVITDRNGAEVPLFGEIRSFATPRVSPDGRRLALSTTTGTRESALWVYDLVSKTFGQLATDNAFNRPEWSPDGSRLYYVSWPANQTSVAAPGSSRESESPRRNTVVSRRWDGGGVVDTMVTPKGIAEEVIPLRDGHHLLLREGTASLASLTLFTLDSVTGQETRPVPSAQPGELEPRVSPDGRWLAYRGSGNVYVRPLTGSGARTQISTEPGSVEPVWSRDGHELFYRSPTRLVAVTLRDGVIVERDSLFADVYAKGGGHAGYDVMPDGQHFVMLKTVGNQAGPLLVVNWLAEVKARLGTNASR